MDHAHINLRMHYTIRIRGVYTYKARKSINQKDKTKRNLQGSNKDQRQLQVNH